jgi:hypothetical protein
LRELLVNYLEIKEDPMSLATLEAMTWSRVPDLVDEWSEKTAAPARDIKQAVSLVFTKSDVGYYWHPDMEKVGMFCRLSPTKQEVELCKMALDRAVGSDHVRRELLDFEDVADGGWVKVAYSPFVRRTGELLNFFPGKYPGGIPNAPSPLAATLTSGLVGAGLGYGVGWLGEKFLPEKWKRGRLRRTLAMLGGGLGAAPGLAWMYSNANRGRSITDGSDLAPGPGDRPKVIDQDDLPDLITDDMLKGAADAYVGRMYTNAVRGFVKEAFATMTNAGHHLPVNPALDVNINKLGQTLWEVGASPQTAATTMGAIYAAQQMPDPYSRPGYVTPNQTGLLGTMMGAAGGGAKGYAAGWAVGKALNVLTGAPAGFQNTLKRSGAALGVVNAVVPRLFH